MGAGSGWSRGGARRRSGPLPAEDPEPIAKVLEGIRGERGLAAGLALGRLGRAWSEVVGERLALETRPVGLHQGSLIVAASSSGWAAQVRFLAGQVKDRANVLLGSEVVSEVRVTLDREVRER
jgi:predicted nucleic acid-binding Zn ribbon protein